jgi:cohesin loading factor subunit SCC2
MDANGYAIQHGAGNPLNGSSMQNVPRRTRTRPPTVNEALPFSPFSSVVPFNSGACSQPLSYHPFNLLTIPPSDIIPIPSIGLRSSASLFSTPAERDEARQGLESLNREAANTGQTSQRLQQTLDDLKQLLQPENVAQ